MAQVDRLSFPSLYLELLAREIVIGSATGFVVDYQNRSYLLTNWHVFSGRHPRTGQVLAAVNAVPDSVRVFYHGASFGKWVPTVEQLTGPDQHARWVEHPRGNEVDVAALPLPSVRQDIRIYPLDLSLGDTDVMPQVAMPVSIIGFPLGLTAGGMLPIWKTGHIASDPDVDYQGSPTFLIDATTRPGMSGSPVVFTSRGGVVRRKNGGMVLGGGTVVVFLGVFSGWIGRDSEVGQVWRPKVITEILQSSFATL